MLKNHSWELKRHDVEYSQEYSELPEDKLLD